MVRFEAQPCRIATAEAAEEACLCLRDGVICAILVRLTDGEPAAQGWYLLQGFGACEGEGLIFNSVDEALEWVKRATEGASAAAQRRP